MNNNDLRVIKTLESIETEFVKLIIKKPLNKITVAEIARNARINPGTFYLHYQDVYDLYDQLLSKRLRAPFEDGKLAEKLFEDPEDFLESFHQAIQSTLQNLMDITKGMHAASLTPETISIFKQQVFSKNLFPQNEANEIKIEIILSSMLATMPLHYENNKPETKKILIKLIKTTLNE